MRHAAPIAFNRPTAGRHRGPVKAGNHHYVPKHVGFGCYSPWHMRNDYVYVRATRLAHASSEARLVPYRVPGKVY